LPSVSTVAEYGAVSSKPAQSPLTENWTPQIVRPLSVTDASTGNVPLTVDPAAGDVIVTAGKGLLAVTDAVAEVAVLP
jgi:hypothetical protein